LVFKFLKLGIDSSLVKPRKFYTTQTLEYDKQENSILKIIKPSTIFLNQETNNFLKTGK
jgi:hypothetical protein